MATARWRQIALAWLAFLAYAVAALWHHHDYRSKWNLEQSGGILFAASYLVYDRPFGSVDSGLANAIRADQSADFFLNEAAHRRIPAGRPMPTTFDGSGLGYPFFATAAMGAFGTQTSSLVLAFVILLGISTALFLLRFRDDRALAVPLLYAGLTALLLTPMGTRQAWLDQVPLGGYRAFVLAGILPAIHVVLELLDRSKPTSAAIALAGLQFATVLGVASVRLSASYFVVAIAAVAVYAIFAGRRDAARRMAAMLKISLLVLVGVVAHAGGKVLIPDAYQAHGLVSDPPWHRMFLGLGAHPDWPFGDLRNKFDCRSNLPQGLVPGIVDANAHCVYGVAVKEGAPPGPIYGSQYDTVVRAAFFRVVQEHPRETAETFLIYKPRLILGVLGYSIDYRISIPAMIALALEVAFVVLMARSTAAATVGQVGGAFVILAAFGLAPPMIAWATLATSCDLVCYMYVGGALIVAAVARTMALKTTLDAAATH